MSASKEKKTGSSVLSETSAKVGKALARSSHKIEETGHKLKKAAEKLGKEAREATHRIEETVDETMDKVKKEVKGLGKKSPAAESSGGKRLCTPGKGMTVDACIGFLAGDIYQYLDKHGTSPLTRVKSAMAEKGHSADLVNMALGWLAREARVSFSTDGAKVSLL